MWIYVPIVFIVAFLMWYFSIWGAADAKLITAVTISIDEQYLIASLLIVAISGGVIALTIGCANYFLGRKIKTVPYGIAISVGGAIGFLAST